MRFLLLIFGGVLMLYPFIVYWSMQRFEPRFIWMGVLLVYLIRLSLKCKTLIAKLFLFLGFIIVAIGMWILNSEKLLVLMPVVISLILAIVFVYSIIEPPTIPARFAEKFEGKLNEKQISYTTKVAWLWVLFFVCNGCAAGYTAMFASREIWMLYNGLVSYMLIACVFGLEYLYRRFVHYGVKNDPS